MYPSSVEREVAHEEEKLGGTSEGKRVETLGKAAGRVQGSVGSRAGD